MKAFLLGLLALVSCSPRTPIDIGYHGSDEGYTAALMAADAWNAACGTELVNVRRGDGEIQAYEQAGTCFGQSYGHTVLERSFLTVLGPKRATSICVMGGSYELPTIAHEFGHALGLGHADHGIMRPGDEWNQLDPETGFQTLLLGLIGPDECRRVVSPST